MRDARAEALPLVGGGEHDWAYLLGRTGWLPRDQIIDQRIWAVGVLVYLVAIAGGLVALVGGPVADDQSTLRPSDQTDDEPAETLSGSTGGP